MVKNRQKKFLLYASLNVPLISRVYVTGTDITKWLPNTHVENLSIEIPNDFPEGEYHLEIAIGGGEYPVVYFANEIQVADGWHKLTTFNVKN